MMLLIQFICRVLMQSQQRALLPEMPWAPTLGLGRVPSATGVPLFQPAPFSNVSLLALGNLLLLFSILMTVVKIP